MLDAESETDHPSSLSPTPSSAMTDDNDSRRSDPQHGGDHDADQSLAWPEEARTAPNALVLCYRWWTFSYMGRVLRKGARQRRADGAHLTPEDLYRVPPAMETAYLDERFHALFDDEEGRLLRTLWRLAAPYFVPAAFCQLLTVLVQIAVPLLVMQVLLLLEERPHQRVARGLPYVVAVFAASAANALGTHRQRHLAVKSGIVLRAAVVSAAYRRALSLTPRGRAGLTAGEVTNLVAVDAQKLCEVMQEGHFLWSCPLSMALVSALLLLIMGPTALVGIAVLAGFVPLTTHITARMVAARRQRARATDERVEIVHAMLHGIKATKLNNYEAKYLDRITCARERELACLRKELFIWASSLTVMVITPVLASALTYVTFVLVDDGNVLTASKTFTTLLLFACLRFPINYVGRLVGKAAQAYESAKRISRFMQRQVRGGSHGSGKESAADQESAEKELDTTTPVLEVRNGKFRVGGCLGAENDRTTWESLGPGAGAGGFSLDGIAVSVRRQEILAVAGPVGAGKSTLANALIGEVPSSPDSVVRRRGRVAYASQTPFILNATLRDNIVFGSPWDSLRYEKVLDACCLRRDVEQLGAAGDLTEIGEKGITLSGGQKQRGAHPRSTAAARHCSVFFLIDFFQCP